MHRPLSPPHLSTVVLTGAGFSVDAGLPVTYGLMSIGAGPVATVARHGKAGVACRSLGGFTPGRLMHGPGL
jgi:hypothetical protein